MSHGYRRILSTYLFHDAIKKHEKRRNAEKQKGGYTISWPYNIPIQTYILPHTYVIWDTYQFETYIFFFILDFNFVCGGFFLTRYSLYIY